MKLGRAFLVLAAGLLAGLALVTSAAGTTSAHTQRKHLQVAVAALAMDGNRIAYDASSKIAAKPAANKVLVWNVRTGKTVKVSGKKTAAADTSSTGGGVFQVAIAGSRVAWLMNEGGNSEGDDYLFTSSLSKPQEHQVASATRNGDGCPGRGNRCAGDWLGGLVGSGRLLAVNRWTTDADNTVTGGELDVLSGSKLKKLATGTDTVEAAVADQGRVAVLLRADRSVALYSAAGKLLRTVDTPPSADAAALEGERLVVATKNQQLLVYDARTGSLRKTLPAHGQANNPKNLDVQGKIAIYTTGNVGELHAVNLSTGKDRVIAKPRGGVIYAQIDSAGLAYVGNGSGTSYGKATLVFKPFSLIKAAVG
jgi:putative pyrroloquinoline-quinone binding quinoprotein